MLRAIPLRLQPRGVLVGLVVGLLCTAAATLVRAALDPWLSTGPPFITYFPAVALAGWLGGRFAGVVALAAGTLAGHFLFVLPRGSRALTDHSTASTLAFVVFGAALLAIVFRWRTAQSALRRTQAVLDQAGQMARVGAWSLEYVDPENLKANPRHWTDETYRIFGYHPGAVRVTHDFVLAHIHPEDRAQLTAAMSRALTASRPYSLEYRIVRSDGRERTLLEHADVQLDSAGCPLRIVGAVQDVTEQRGAEKSLRESSERLRRIVEHIHDGLIIDDVHGRVVFANDRFLEMFGFERSQLETISLEDYVAPGYRQLLRERHEQRIRGEDVPAQFEYEGLAADGRRMWVEVTVVPVLDDHGKMIGTQSALRDITERKRLEEELRRKADELSEANRIKDEFIATVSHELRTPLNAILGWAELLREGRLAAAAEERALEVIANNARRQAQLIEDLLDLSRIVAGKLRLEPLPIDPVLPVHAAIEAVQPSAEAKGIALRGPQPTSGVLVLADASRLQQVMWNLLSNAIKFTPPGGTVSVDVRVRDGEMDLVVADSGCGIPPRFLPHVFDRFRQADAGFTRRHGGLGIGLSIVRHLVEAHGGQVRVESEGEEKGSTFIVTLPLRGVQDRRRLLASPVPRRAHVAAVAQPRGQDLAGLRVLAVDDEPDARELTAVVLRQYGAEVLSAASADEALEVLGRDRPDVLVIDIAMPGVDGYSLLRTIREQGGDAAQIPAIALTAYARDEDRRRALATGFALHLTKPVEEAVLVRAVATASEI